MATKLMLLGILLVTLATFLQTDSSGMSGAWEIVALVGLIVGLIGFFTRDLPVPAEQDRPSGPTRPPNG